MSSAETQDSRKLAAATRKTLLLWGETQSGKTTLVTSAVTHPVNNDLLPLIDRRRSLDQLIGAGVVQGGRGLFEGRPVESTTRNSIDLVLTLAGGDELQLRDIKGNNTQNIELMRKWLPEIDGVLFIVECGGPRYRQQMAAVNTLLSLVVGTTIKIGLAITKCERMLCPSDLIWDARPGCWKLPGFQDLWRPFESVLTTFGDAVWPVSSFGYDEDRPACVLSEYGQYLPYGVQPKNVCEPLRWFLREFRLC